ncbi:MAG: AAA family ATPase [Candidatus Omnitrophica bacterium]|nr:AAA family ATPase [Candidatus Omnitrophota bacterium]
MYFKKLEIVGFKSFLIKTSLHFEPGITAIVGPNGCGKSNIFDSIRWVLGEQSAKSLRGSEMQDVIFNGTDSKEALSMAEVSLTFDNAQKFFPVDAGEVTITRRIFRSGESEYLLNKTLVRLKDINDLLAGTGIGAESYSMVAQGKIDLILSSRPEDRRMVFDEASGITRYKSQKREAMRKLEETEQNLLRVNDIVTEVKRQIGSLERQANKARRYKEVFEELKSKEINMAVFQKKELLKEKDEIIAQLSQLQTKESELLEIIKDQEAKISNRQAELKLLEDSIMSVKNSILSFDNEVIRNKERIGFNKEKISELEDARQSFFTQIEQAKSRLTADEEKLNKAKEEYNNIHKDIEDKAAHLKEKEIELNNLAACIKISLENIAKSKKNILDLAMESAKVKNDIADFTSKEQIFLARKKRLELEKAKLHEEKTTIEDNLQAAAKDVETTKGSFEDLNLKITGINDTLNQENESLNSIISNIECQEKEKLTLESHKEFIEKLKTKYEDIGEAMNAVIQLDKLPQEQLTGLVIKIKAIEKENFKLSGEAKPIDLDTTKIEDRIREVQKNLDSLKESKIAKEDQIQKLKDSIQGMQQDLRSLEINLANKKNLHQNILDQFNKLKEEKDIVNLELSDTEKELSSLEAKLAELKTCLSVLEKEHANTEELIVNEQNSISLNSDLKEKSLVAIAQAKTELDNLNRRLGSDEATLKIMEDAYNHGKANLEGLQKQIQESEEKSRYLSAEIEELGNKIIEAENSTREQKLSLKNDESKYREISDGAGGVFAKIDSDRKGLDALKDRLYQLQMQNKDVDFKFQSMKDRVCQAYKIDLETMDEAVVEQIQEPDLLADQIQVLKEKLDSYGTVNLVAIEEYDELKKRYDFLMQQQNDLNSAKESLHQAILKINRTTKEMFLETFEKVREEFRNYFKLLFNGGDAQVFLIDEQDPLESGIEIICRPPGKKLQNVLLLSGGEKALSAVALIFAIFKVKPSPFCILDEIDAPLDEANVDRFGRLLQEFTQTSQFIVITHNKKTIANASVMYGITMEQSGVSKIVSVKFGQNKPKENQVQDNQPDSRVAEPV